MSQIPPIPANTYPQWGEVIDKPYSMSREQLIKRITAVALFTLATAAVPGLITQSLIVGACAGVATLTVFTVVLIARALFCHYHKNNYRLDFPSARIVSPTAPQLGENSQTDLLVSNRVNETFEWKKDLVRSAQHSIEISFNYAGGEKLEEFLALVEERLRERPQLRVHIIVSDDLLNSTNLKTLARLQLENEGRFQHIVTKGHFIFSPFFASQENHVKLLIVDEKYFVTGGSGINLRMVQETCAPEPEESGTFRSKLLDKTTRDTDLIGCGSIASTMRHQFFTLYRKWEYRMHGTSEDRIFALECSEEEKGICERFDAHEQLVRTCPARLIVSGPEHRKQNPITREIIRLIKNAESEIRIANSCFNPLSEVREALKDAKNRNVKVITYVKGMRPGATICDWVAAPQARGNYDVVTKAYEHEIPNQCYHKKVATIDERIAMIGTNNFSLKSQASDDEIMVVIESEEIARQVNEGLRDDKGSARAVKEKALRASPIKTHLGYFIATTLVSPFN